VVFYDADASVDAFTDGAESNKSDLEDAESEDETIEAEDEDESIG
jgi:hypothetical protein